MAIINNTWNIEHFQLKQHNAAEWSESYSDYVLAAGEIGLELDTSKTKLGDGVKTWAQLDYYSDPVLKGLVDAITSRVQSLESDMTQAKSDITEAQGKITTLEGDMTTAKGDISTLKEKVAAIEGITTISVNATPANGE